MTVFRFVEQEKATFPVATMCRVLGVSPSGYWAWRRRDPSEREISDAVLTDRIRDIHRVRRGTYGCPRVHAELAHQGIHVGRKRVDGDHGNSPVLIIETPQAIARTWTGACQAG